MGTLSAVKGALLRLPFGSRLVKLGYGALSLVLRLRHNLQHLIVIALYSRGGSKTIRTSGFTLTEGTQDPYVRDVLFNGAIERVGTELEVLRRQLRTESPVILDVGANVGFYTCFFARWPGARVHSFEPVRSTFGYLSRNVDQNGFANVTCHNKGLSARDERLFIGVPTVDTTWRLDRLKSGRFSVYSDPAQAPQGEVAEFTTLDAFVAEQQLDRIDLMKIDVEGHEAAVLDGGEATIRRLRPVLYMEIKEGNLRASGVDERRLLARVRDFGYRCFYWRHGRLREIVTDHDLPPGQKLSFDLIAISSDVAPQ